VKKIAVFDHRVSFDASCPGNLSDYLHKPYIAKTKFIGYVFAAHGMVLFLFKFLWWAPKDMYLKQNA